MITQCPFCNRTIELPDELFLVEDDINDEYICDDCVDMVLDNINGFIITLN